ncbi:MAG: class I SAM-dependent methyltransferase [Candidatus Aminicenantes bacterium]|nr:class I SAM-dependent methyltransferase [Candidatus Aminicenantes bacterium]
MHKGLIPVVLVLTGFLAVPPPAAVQDLTWQSFKGYDVPYVPTPTEVVDEMLHLAGVKAGDVLYDLGCGDGRIVIAAAKRYGVKAVGIDIDPLRIQESNANAAAAGLTGKVRFIQQDLFETDLRDATVITMYLLTSVNLRLRPKLLADLKPGTRLVSHSFEMGEWRPDKTSLVTTSFGDERDVHFWIVPANVTGRWEWDLAGGDRSIHCVLEAAQEFQDVTAAGKEGDWPLAVGDIRLTGDVLSFRIDTEADGKMVSTLYEGRVAGDRIAGTVRPAGAAKAAAVAWKASRDPRTAVSIAK